MIYQRLWRMYSIYMPALAKHYADGIEYGYHQCLHPKKPKCLKRLPVIKCYPKNGHQVKNNDQCQVNAFIHVAKINK